VAWICHRTAWMEGWRQSAAPRPAAEEAAISPTHARDRAGRLLSGGDPESLLGHVRRASLFLWPRLPWPALSPGRTSFGGQL